MSASDEREIKDVVSPLKDLCLEDSGGLLSKMEDIQCPFTWKLKQYYGARDVLRVTEEKLMHCNEEEDPIGPWSMFVYCLVLCHEYGEREQWQEATEYLQRCENALDGLRKNPDPMWCGMAAGLEHVNKATGCFVKAKMQKREEAEEMLAEVTPLDQLESKHQAAVWGLRGAVCIEFGYEGAKDCSKFIDKAVQLDEECGEWHFLKGKVLGRLRRIEKWSISMPEEQELNSLERAVELTNDPHMMIFLAQSYREAACSKDINSRRQFSEDELCRKSHEYYRRGLLVENNACVIARCGSGFMKLPRPWNDMNEAKKCVLKALDLAPDSPFVHHVAGTYFKYTREFEKAKYHLSIAGENGNPSAFFELITLKSKENECYDPLPELETMLLFDAKPVKQKVRCEMAAYLYYVKKDFKSALSHWAPVIEDDADSEFLKESRNIFGKLFMSDIRPTIITGIKQHLRGASKEEKQQMEHLLACLEPFVPWSELQRANDSSAGSQGRARESSADNWRTNTRNIPDNVEAGCAAFWRSQSSRGQASGVGRSRISNPRTWRTQASKNSERGGLQQGSFDN